MDEELRTYIEETWGRYEAALAEKDSRLARHQHIMALVRTLASVAAVGLLIYLNLMG